MSSSLYLKYSQLNLFLMGTKELTKNEGDVDFCYREGGCIIVTLGSFTETCASFNSFDSHI